MGAELAKEVFQPPPPSYQHDTHGLFWIHSPTKRVPAIMHHWEGQKGEKPLFTLLVCNSNTVDMCSGRFQSWLLILKEALHVNVLCFDYTGFGLNEGIPSEESCYEDTQIVFKWLVDNYPESDVILLGIALGCGPAIELIHTLSPASPHRHKRGSRIGHFGKMIISGIGTPHVEEGNIRLEEDNLYLRISGLILQSGFTSILDIAAGGKFHLGVTDMFENLKKLDKLRCNVYLAHGEEDQVIPKAHSKKLAKKLGNLVWALKELEGVGHANFESSDDYLDDLIDFVDFLMPPGQTLKTELVAPKRYTDSPMQVVSAWLSQYAMSQYTNLFLSSGYFDLEIIKHLDELDIQGMGVEETHIPLILRAISDLKNPPAAPTMSLVVPPSPHTLSSPTSESIEVLGDKRIEWKDLSLERCLKKGFFEQVHVASWKNRKVVVRTMPSKQQQLSAFCKQVRSLCDLNHNHLLLPLGVCVDPPNLCIVTPYMEEGSLADLLRKANNLDYSRIHDIATQISEALSYLHALDPPIIHKDLTATNILISKNKIMVGDFGLSRPPSFLWMAPEIFLSKKYSPASDVFSFGVIVWQLLFGEDIPYRDLRPAEAAMKVANNYRLPLPNLQNHTLPQNLRSWSELVHDCWHSQPEKRPTIMEIKEKLIDDQEDFLGNQEESSEQGKKENETILQHCSIDEIEKTRSGSKKGEGWWSESNTVEQTPPTPLSSLAAIERMELLLTDIQDVLHQVKLIKMGLVLADKQEQLS
eukprot:CAMPEP_0174255042 /NCGR_PEP_ID=MMETSP0439-20130205/4382_1 /TAXON_ID=0 /ORGANISM="Stereomyxa ramosa, Strain Chinc5" /LENGTH=753 /DNA_ID=CAMNT_0015337023 /DNA_START=47 /DNA_END=2308 /DNA_ORIENTATION=-